MSGNHDSLRILILNGDLPFFPGRAGHEYLHTTHLARLTQQVGLVSLIHNKEQREKKRCLSDAGIKLFLWESPNSTSPSETPVPRSSLRRRIGRGLYGLARARLRRPQDTLIQDFSFRNISKPLLDALKDQSWQILAIVQSSCAHWLNYLPKFPVSVLILHDVRALVCERKARTVNSFLLKLKYNLKSWQHRHFERKFCRKFDLVITVSSSDEAWVRKHYEPKQSVTVPIPVDAKYFKPMPQIPEEKNRILFTGMMNHMPNVDAVQYFTWQIMPKIRKAVPKAEFWIVGRDPLPEVKALSDLPGVVVTGFVPDIRPYIAQATVVVVPLRFGSGMRNKILEAWAMGKSVISTQLGAEGLDYKDEENILIAEDGAMAEQVIRVLRNKELRDRIRAKGRDLVRLQHHPDKLAKKYHQAIASVAREKQVKKGSPHTVIDLRWMVPGMAGGIENLSRSFVNHLLELDGFNHYTLLLPSLAKYDFDLRRNPNFRVTIADGPSPDYRLLLWRASQFFHRCFNVDYWRSPEVETLRRGRALNADLALSMSGYICPDMFHLRNILIVHDLQHEYHPEFFSSQVLEERKKVFGESILRADYLVAVSDYTRNTVIERLKIDPDRIVTVYEAADPIFHPENRTTGNKARVLRKYNLPENGYLFFPARTWPHKNHKGAFEALHMLNREYGQDLLLVCTGGQGEAHSDLLKFRNELGIEDKIIFLGYCPVTDIVGLYEGAAALVYPSFFEGFGIPLLEAMWCDCPIVCSNLTSLPEIAGDAGLQIDPRNPWEIAESVNCLLSDASLRTNLVKRGREQARRFSWSNFTRELLRILHFVRSNF